MTKGEAQQLESDVVIFPMDNKENNREILLTKKAVEDASIEEKSMKNNFDERFARLKKSLRRKAASIL